jgi:hypothetical protein
VRYEDVFLEIVLVVVHGCSEPLFKNEDKDEHDLKAANTPSISGISLRGVLHASAYGGQAGARRWLAP